MIGSAAAVSSVAPPRPSGGERRKHAGRFAIAEGVSSAADPIRGAARPASVAEGVRPWVGGIDLPQDRGVIEQFCADLATAPQLAGELMALYAEQYPRLALRFAAIAVKECRDAPQQIEAAARWREVCGAVLLAELIRAALALACPPAEPAPPLVPADVLDLDAEWLNLSAAADTVCFREEQVLPAVGLVLDPPHLVHERDEGHHVDRPCRVVDIRIGDHRGQRLD